ncbi:AzlD domain-containing protein [Desulfovibrio sp. OttesenSCG-928-G15]|nr:AzlD domain-containing protein [Desulfovibrio sp. OttesenSCG-928-G15]
MPELTLSSLLPPDQLVLIAGMALVTYIPRALPLMVLSSREINPLLMRWLEMVPPAVLAALLAPELFLRPGPEKTFFFSSENVFLMAAVPTVIVGWLTKSFFGTVAAGMVMVALLRYFF